MKIALDWDDTCTRDLPFWKHFVETCKRSKVDVRIVTMRYPREIDDDMRSFDIQIYCTSRRFKREYMNNKPWQPDIWIDDTPDFIVGKLWMVDKEVCE